MGSSLRSKLDIAGRRAPETVTPLTYRFFTTSAGNAKLRAVALPTHPLNPSHGLKLGLQVDDAPMRIVDFRTAGRSDTWKQNVLSNSAVGELEILNLGRGVHTIKVYALDPAIVADRFEILFEGAPQRYARPPLANKDELNGD
jgi:hypothetical protein